MSFGETQTQGLTLLLDFFSVLKAVISNAKSRGLDQNEERLVRNILEDAKDLAWGDGQLEKRVKAVESISAKKFSSLWRSEKDLYRPSSATS